MILDEDTRRFMRGQVSVIVSAADARLNSSLVRALGCRVEQDDVRVFLAAEQSARLLDDLRSGSSVAVVFSQPSTHRTVQLKSRDLRLGRLQAGDEAIIEGYRQGFVAELQSIGLPAALAETLLWPGEAPVVALDFRVAEAFLQTPGPNAGQPLKAGA